MRALSLTVLVSAAIVEPMLAQTEDGAIQAGCQFVGQTYSPGATIRAGNQVMQCASDYTWELTDLWSAGCFFEDKFFSVGSVNKGSASGDVRTICLENGTWERLDPDGIGAGICFYKGEPYSPGSENEAGTRCSHNGTWVVTEAEIQSVNCIHEGKFFSVGSEISGSKVAERVSRCLQDGTWETIE